MSNEAAECKGGARAAQLDTRPCPPQMVYKRSVDKPETRGGECRHDERPIARLAPGSPPGPRRLAAPRPFVRGVHGPEARQPPADGAGRVVSARGAGGRV